MLNTPTDMNTQQQQQPTSQTSSPAQQQQQSPSQTSSPAQSPSQTSSPAYSTNYRERVSQIKNNSKQAVQDAKQKVVQGIDDGKADPLIQKVYDGIYEFLCAPYELLTYACTTLITLDLQRKKRFSLIGTYVSLVIAGIYLAMYLFTAEIKYMVDVGGATLAIVFLQQLNGIDLSEDLNLDELREDDMYL